MNGYNYMKMALKKLKKLPEIMLHLISSGNNIHLSIKTYVIRPLNGFGMSKTILILTNPSTEALDLNPLQASKYTDLKRTFYLSHFNQ